MIQPFVYSFNQLNSNSICLYNYELLFKHLVSSIRQVDRKLANIHILIEFDVLIHVHTGSVSCFV